VQLKAKQDESVHLQGLRILAAEDNMVNQAVLRGMLGKLNHSLTVVTTGAAAVDSWERESFDLILMDVQMPEMNGYQATEAIRRKEAAAGGRHIPIIAMTAHAMQGDTEKCLATGMDDYISKPLVKSRLLKLIDSYGAKGTAPEKLDSSFQFNRSELLEELGGDEGALSEVIASFRKTSPGFMQELTQAMSAEDVPTTRRLAHTLKNNVGIFGASAIVDLLDQIEGFAQRKDFELARASFSRVIQEMDGLSAAINHSAHSQVENAHSAPAIPEGECVLDPMRLASLRTLGESRGDGFLATLLETFCRNAMRDIKEMNAAFNTGDLAALWFKVHSVKGASENIGAQRMVNSCQQLENCKDGPGKDDIGALIARLAGELEQVQKEVTREPCFK
jgi:CheY-like chemotaxis protein